MLEELRRLLTPLVTATPAVVEPPRGPDARGVHWVKPEIVAEVEYTSITEEGLLRHATFRGLRRDKAAREVVLERAKRTP